MSKQQNKKENLDFLVWEQKHLPDKISPDEDIILLSREDISLIVIKALVSSVMIFFGLLLRVIIVGQTNVSVVIAGYDVFLYTFINFVLASFLYNFHNYYLSMQIVTDRRIVDIDQEGLFTRQVNELSMDKIQDVTYKQDNVIATLFNFGNVLVKTASSGEANIDPLYKSNGFVFENVPNPQDVTKIIANTHYKYTHMANLEKNPTNPNSPGHNMRMGPTINQRGVS